MSVSESYVGLDPDAARTLADAVRRAAEVAGGAADALPGRLTAADLVDMDVASWCREVSEELMMLADLLGRRAIEAIDARWYLDAGTAELSDELWLSLTDGVGVAVDFAAVGPGSGSVPIGPSVAATELAAWLEVQGPDASMSFDDLVVLAGDPGADPILRTAAAFFVANDGAWQGVHEEFVLAGPLPDATAASFRDFVAVNAALATVAGATDRADIAAHGGKPDGVVSTSDIDAVLADASGRFSAAEQAAFALLAERQFSFDGALLPAWQDVERLTSLLFTRQVFVDSPAVAAAYVDLVVTDPRRYISDLNWADTPAGQSWLTSAIGATDDPARQGELIVKFASIYQTTTPVPLTLIGAVHQILDLGGMFDPFGITDFVSAALYTAEGDHVSAAASAAGIVVPFVTGAMLRAGSDAITAVLRHGEVVVDGVRLTHDDLIAAIKAGELTLDEVEDTIDAFARTFGDDQAAILRTRFDDVVDDVNSTSLVPGGGLAAHEARQYGHTLAEHVNVDDALLHQRLRDEPWLEFASRWTSRRAAEATIGHALATHGGEISEWLQKRRPKTHDLVIPVDSSVGRVVGRGGARPDAATAVVRLRRDPTFPGGYYVETAFLNPAP